MFTDNLTVWNYRREIIMEIIFNNPEKTIENKQKFIIAELKLLLKLLMRNQKSFPLWFHRQWCIVKGIEEQQFRHLSASSHDTPMTIRGGGDPRHPVASYAEVKNGPATPEPSPPMRMAASWSSVCMDHRIQGCWRRIKAPPSGAPLDRQSHKGTAET